MVVFFLTKKFLDFQDFVLAGHIIQSGKHTTELGIKLLNLLKEGMNTGRNYLEENVNNLHKESLIKEVLAMEVVYISNKDGLRVDSNSLALISNQLFYILASSSDGDSFIFENTEECSKYFGVSKQTINVRLASGKPINREDKVYTLRRSSLPSIN